MYLGGFVNEEDAARAYDLAALACKGPSVPTNFAASQYEDNLSEIRGSSRVPCQLPPAPLQTHSLSSRCAILVNTLRLTHDTCPLP